MKTQTEPLKLARRELLAAGAVSAAALMAGCESPEQFLTRPTMPENALPPGGMTSMSHPSPAVRLLNRLAYGPRPGDVAHVQEIGQERFVAEQLDPDSIDEDPAATWRVHALGDLLTSDTGMLFDEDDHRLVGALRQASILRAVYSRKQLLERMVEFWTDHFNIYAFKGAGPQYKVVDDSATIRAHALGKFRDLLGASAKSAAMLGYLDNTVNRKGVPNENYARELMELHTLGVDGGYTQHDVKEVARCLTGWTMERHWRRGRFRFDSSTHDNGPKRVLGHVIPAGGGIQDGETVLDIVARHPSTARHLSRKLCVFFLGEAKPEKVKHLSGIFLKTGGNIPSVLRDLLTSPDLLTARPILKRPFDYTVSAMRAFNADTDGGSDVQAHLERMGQPLFAWPTPDGFPEKMSAWTGALIPRWNFGMALAAGKLKNTTIDHQAIAAAGKARGLTPHETLIELAFGRSAADPAFSTLRHCVQSHPDPAEYMAILTMSPDFQWR